MATLADIEWDFEVNRSVLALGICDDDSDDEITEVLGPHGRVTKIVRVNPEQVVIEFESEEAVAHLTTRFPFEIATAKDPALKWCLDSIDKLMASASQPPLTVETGLSIPIRDGSDSGETDGSDSEKGGSDNSVESFASIPPKQKSHNPPAPTSSTSKSFDKATRPKVRAVKVTPAVLSKDALNPKDVQRIIVEHVIKSEVSASSPSPKRLRSFSGRMPKPPGEVDYETWCLHVELMFQDGLPIDMQRRMILESLLSPALDIVRQLGPSSSPLDYVRLLQSAYGLVDDGEEIFAKFLNTHQDSGEKASEYLQRLQAILSTAIRRGGVSGTKANRQLFKQFTRGCWDQTLLLTLQQKINNDLPPDFSELLLQLRTEEERRAVKMDRMQRHFGSSKVKPTMHFQYVSETVPKDELNTDILQKYITETESLRKQVSELQIQLTEKRTQRRKKHEPKTTTAPEPLTATADIQVHQQVSRPQPKPWFCFKCGENGHIARQCENPPNKDLVDKKYKELKAKQQEWKDKQGQALNWTGFQ